MFFECMSEETHSEFANPITDMKKDGIAKWLRILHGNGIEFLL